MKNKSILALLVLVLSLGLIVSGCGGAGGDKKPAAENKAPVKIGFFAPVTGPAAADGDSVTKAAKLDATNISVQATNSKGKVQKKLIITVRSNRRRALWAKKIGFVFFSLL